MFDVQKSAKFAFQAHGFSVLLCLFGAKLKDDPKGKASGVATLTMSTSPFDGHNLGTFESFLGVYQELG